MAIGCDRRIPTDSDPIRADELAAGLPRRAWHRLSAGPGAKGQRIYDWAWIDHTDRAHSDDALDTQCWSLLIRRHRNTGELAYYRCYSPEPVPLRELVRVAGRRPSRSSYAAVIYRTDNDDYDHSPRSGAGRRRARST